jgi:hypothetical protein
MKMYETSYLPGNAAPLGRLAKQEAGSIRSPNVTSFMLQSRKADPETQALR